jgi:RNA polymerase sigma-70 factor (ECF subfamily)
VISTEASDEQPAVVAIDERSLLLRHRDGERGAFAELVQRYRAPVYSYLTRCGVAVDDRDDLFQEIFIKVHRSAATYDESRPLHPWIFTIVANTVRTYMRRQRVRDLVYSSTDEDGPAGGADPPADNPDSERSAVARETVAWLAREIAQLPLAKREVLILACIEAMPLKEVAEALAMPLSTVKTHLRRARMALAERLARHQRGEVSS